LYDIFISGCINSIHQEAIIELKGEGLRAILEYSKQSKPIHLEIGAECYYELFGVNIPVGLTNRKIIGFIEMTQIEIEEAITQSNDEKFVPIKLVRVNVTETFPNLERRLNGK